MWSRPSYSPRGSVLQAHLWRSERTKLRRSMQPSRTASAGPHNSAATACAWQSRVRSDRNHRSDCISRRILLRSAIHTNFCNRTLKPIPVLLMLFRVLIKQLRCVQCKDAPVRE